MTFIDAARRVLETRTCHLLRPRRGTVGEYDCKPWATGRTRGWFYLDQFSASAVVAVYGRINERNKRRLERMTPAEAVLVAMRLAVPKGEIPARRGTGGRPSSARLPGSSSLVRACS